MISDNPQSNKKKREALTLVTAFHKLPDHEDANVEEAHEDDKANVKDDQEKEGNVCELKEMFEIGRKLSDFLDQNEEDGPDSKEGEFCLCVCGRKRDERDVSVLSFSKEKGAERESKKRRASEEFLDDGDDVTMFFVEDLLLSHSCKSF